MTAYVLNFKTDTCMYVHECISKQSKFKLISRLYSWGEFSTGSNFNVSMPSEFRKNFLIPLNNDPGHKFHDSGFNCQRWKKTPIQCWKMTPGSIFSPGQYSSLHLLLFCKAIHNLNKSLFFGQDFFSLPPPPQISIFFRRFCWWRWHTKCQHVYARNIVRRNLKSLNLKFLSFNREANTIYVVPTFC